MATRIISSDETRELAMLWLRSQDLSGVSPEALLELYQSAYQAINNHSKRKAKEASVESPPNPAVGRLL